ncbi:MAG TPA: hypothetical protein VJN89_05135 [Candidatus Acidoferrum sp.]|nr:hypothetical protein [Candidatus Acidoferrum sp.]
MLIHDESKFIEKQRELWETILNPTNPAAVVGQDRRTIEFPLPVNELRLENSRNVPQLQVADLIASAARAHANGLVTKTKEPFLEGLWEAGLKHAFDGGVWPTARVRPEELETEGPVFGDAAAFISSLAKPRKN